MKVLKKIFGWKNYSKILPPEMLLRIFQYLPKNDLCSACLVSKWWNSVGSDGSLWKKFWVEIVINDVERAKHILKCSRFSKLFLNYNYAVEERHITTRTIMQSNISRLNMKWVDLRFVMKDAVLLLTKLESLTITSCRMEQEQADEIFQRLKDGTSLKEICIINPVIKSTHGIVGLSNGSSQCLFLHVRQPQFSKGKSGLTCPSFS